PSRCCSSPKSTRHGVSTMPTSTSRIPSYGARSPTTSTWARSTAPTVPSGRRLPPRPTRRTTRSHEALMDDLFGPLLVGCAVALASAIGVVLARRPIYAAIFLLVHSLSLAALFGILSAAMGAVRPVMLYSGVIVVLFLFLVTLLPSGGRELGPTGSRVAAGLIAGGGLVVARGAAHAPRRIPHTARGYP